MANAKDVSRRRFLQAAGTAAIGAGAMAGQAGADDVPKDAQGNVIAGFEKSDKSAAKPGAEWKPISDRRIRVGIAGFGLCQFGAQFFFQSHPNVEVVAVTDLVPQRRDGLAAACRCEKTYDSCEKMLDDDQIEAVFLATDAPSHARLAVRALERGKHVASAVPAVFGENALEDAEQLYKAVQASGKKYMMFETSTFHADCYAWRQDYHAGRLGKLIYSEGEYYHPSAAVLAGYNPATGKVDVNGWRKGLPPMWYPTHATAYYVSVTGGRLTEVSCVGNSSIYPPFKPDANDYDNPFGTQVAMFKTSEGGMSRMAVSWDMPSAHGEKGRVYGQKTPEGDFADRARPALPPKVAGGSHGGSHGHLTSDFVEAILTDREPIVPVGDALNMTLAGVIAHESARKEGEWMKVPQFEG